MVTNTAEPAAERLAAHAKHVFCRVEPYSSNEMNLLGDHNVHVLRSAREVQPLGQGSEIPKVAQFKMYFQCTRARVSLSQPHSGCKSSAGIGARPGLLQQHRDDERECERDHGQYQEVLDAESRRDVSGNHRRKSPAEELADRNHHT